MSQAPGGDIWNCGKVCLEQLLNGSLTIHSHIFYDWLSEGLPGCSATAFDIFEIRPGSHSFHLSSVCLLPQSKANISD